MRAVAENNKQHPGKLPNRVISENRTKAVSENQTKSRVAAEHIFASFSETALWQGLSLLMEQDAGVFAEAGLEE